MANTRNGNSFYVDSVSNSGTAQSFIAQKGLKITEVLFTSSAAGDSLTVADMDPQNSAAGAQKLVIKNGVANDTKIVPFHSNVVSFPNGIWVSGLSTGATALIVLTSSGN